MAELSGIREQKSILRRQVQGLVRSLIPAYREEASVKARSLLVRQAIWQEAKTILLYAPTSDEIDIWPLVAVALEESKVVALPRFDAVTDTYEAGTVQNLETDVRTGRFGIREPTETSGDIPIKLLDLILVPGVAFDLQGHRIGRGKGYYDRVLDAACGKKCGVAFDEQIVPRVPIERHDAVLNCILTPTRWMEV